MNICQEQCICNEYTYINCSYRYKMMNRFILPRTKTVKYFQSKIREMIVSELRELFPSLSCFLEENFCLKLNLVFTGMES